MGCGCKEQAEANFIDLNRREFEIIQSLPDAQAQREQILIAYGTDGSGLIDPNTTEDELCYALKLYVYYLCEFEARRLEFERAGAGFLTGALGSGAVLFAAGVLTGGLGVALGLALAAGASSFGFISADVRINALKNRVNQARAVCHLLAEIPFNNPNRIELDAALDSLPATNQNEEIVREALQRLGKAEKYGHYFLLATIADVIENGFQANSCECETGFQIGFNLGDRPLLTPFAFSDVGSVILGRFVNVGGGQIVNNDASGGTNNGFIYEFQVPESVTSFEILVEGRIAGLIELTTSLDVPISSIAVSETSFGIPEVNSWGVALDASQTYRLKWIPSIPNGFQYIDLYGIRSA